MFWINNKKIGRWIDKLWDEYLNGKKRTAEKIIGKDSTSSVHLIRAINDSNRDVRRKAVLALGEIGNAQAVELLIKALGDRSWLVREKAAEILGKIGDVHVVGHLVSSLEDESWDVRGKSAEALGRIGDILAVGPLIKALKDNNLYVRKKAAGALGKIGDARTVKHLVRALEDEDNDVRMESTEAIRKLCSRIESIVFGVIPTNENITTLNYPDISKLHIPIKNLNKILIHVETYNLIQVEQFITYAVNYIGERHLKEYVEVYIYGDPEKLNPNLNNLFNNLCKKVEFHDRV